MTENREEEKHKPKKKAGEGEGEGKQRAKHQMEILKIEKIWRQKKDEM